ncbi:MAG: ABC transporter permease [Actinomycetota bacterium]
MSSVEAKSASYHSSGTAANLRLFFVGGLISYRALFNWLHPSIYIPTMLGSPLFQILFFAYVGRYSGLRDDTFFVVGNAVQVSSMAAIYGMTMTIANERYFGTLMPLLATPANRVALFLGRSLPPVANGVLVSAFGFMVGALFLDFEMPASSIPALAAVVLVTVCSCTALGMTIGSIGMRARDVFFASNLIYFFMLLLCGVNVPIEVLPGWMQAIGNSLPLTHGIQAAREIAGGASLSDVSGLVGTEALVGLIYAAAAYGLFRLFEFEGRRTGSLTTF